MDQTDIMILPFGFVILFISWSDFFRLSGVDRWWNAAIHMTQSTLLSERGMSHISPCSTLRFLSWQILRSSVELSMPMKLYFLLFMFLPFPQPRSHIVEFSGKSLIESLIQVQVYVLVLLKYDDMLL